jgi:integrase
VTGSAAGPSDGDGGRRRLTYDVRIWTTRVVNGARGRAYQVRWTVAGKVRKHRAAQEVRPVPISPALTRLLRDHLAEYDTAPDGRLFRGEAGDLLSDTVCTRTWEKARQAVLTKVEAASPLAARPYHLRYARLSTWLNAGVAPAQVAEWAGNSVPVLLRVYAKCLTDSEQTALKRIEDAEADTNTGPRAE